MQDSSSNVSTNNINAPSHHLWEPKPHEKTNGVEPARWSSPSPSSAQQTYRLRISVLRDGEFQGDAPSRVYSFPSLHHLTHATNALDNAFPSSVFNIQVKKAGVETPISDVDLGHGTEGHLEDVTIEYTSTEEEDENGELRDGEQWDHLLGRLRMLEDVWDSNRS